MKTRSNMPLYVLEVSNVKTLSNAQIDLLRCGDYLVKKDASGEHAYKVTFKSDTGMCITYHDASVVETQSYDKIDGVWTYNSEDKTPNLLELQNVEDAPDGTINKALGLDSNGGLVKGTISGGTKLYKHTINLGTGYVFSIINNKSDAYKQNDFAGNRELLDDSIICGTHSPIIYMFLYSDSSTHINIMKITINVTNNSFTTAIDDCYSRFVSDTVTEL